MTFIFTFDEPETNLIWNILNSAQIAGKDAPILTGIFQKMQDSIRTQAQAAQESGEMRSDAAPVVEPEVENSIQ